MTKTTEFDIIIFGASGFTGRLVAEYLATQYAEDGDLRWAMAGRNLQKLEQVRGLIGAPENTPLLTADSDDLDSLKALVSRTSVVITTVGPYQLYGHKLVQACAEVGTDYVDLCGETTWMRHMIDAHQQSAQNSGARIVFSCGFDSIPSDMGVYYLQEAAQQKFSAPLTTIRCRVKEMNGKFSGGTAASLKASLAAAKDPAVLQLMLDHFSLTPDFSGPQQPPGNSPFFEDDLNSWTAPFIMAAINTRNVHRSNALLGHPYGKDFIYDEMMLTGPGEKGEAIANHVANDKSLNSDSAPKPGEGPNKEEREAGSYHLLFFGETDDGQQLQASVAGFLDPGYGSTSKMIAESAICLLRDDIGTEGGIWTTAPAMGDHLIKRLVDNAGLVFKLGL